MNYAIEEGVVDAFVAYLTQKVSGVQVRAAPSAEPLQYPCVAVRAEDTSPIAPNVSWSDAVKTNIQIAVISPAQDEVSATGEVVNTARARNADLRAAVITALTVKDSATAPAGLSGLCQPEDVPKGLAAELTAMLVPGVWITSAQPRSPLAQMEVSDDNKTLVTVIGLSVIAQAVEL